MNRIFERAHLPYEYASSRELYEGVDSFQRVVDPQPGDLIVWRGHVGIVVDPVTNSFVSALRTGVKLANYFSPYWKRRGTPRFLRYVGRDSVLAYSVRGMQAGTNAANSVAK